MSYRDALNYLAQKTSVIELYDQLGGRVAVCPEWNGSVLTSTCSGLEGESFGCVNVQAIDAGCRKDFGGEYLWTHSPLIYSFAVENIQGEKAVLQRTLNMADANGMPREFHLTQSISLLSRKRIGTMFGDAVADALAQSDVSVVGFDAENTVRTQERAHVACRQRGMFNASPHTAVIVPALLEGFAPKPFSIDVDYLGGAPHGRIRHLSKTLLIRADGQGKCQVTMPFFTSLPIFGAVDFRSGTLTLWTFDLPNDPEKNDVIRIYNPGRPSGSEFDRAMYYEINCFSAVRELLPDDFFTYYQCTLHLSADNSVLDGIIRQTFGISLEGIAKTMLW